MNETTPANSSAPRAIVGVGASAGGVAAFQKFLEGVPSDTDLAFVLLPHLHPEHESHLDDILSKSVSIPVVEIEQPTPAAAGHVYVLAPDCSLTIENKTLYPETPAQKRYHHTPTDIFLRSLAEEMGEWAAGVVLSGTGSDGTIGLRAIKARAGLTLAQDAEEAEFPGMPQAASRDGCVDFVQPAKEMYATLLKYFDGIAEEPSDTDAQVVGRIIKTVHRQTGYDFRHYKSNTIHRRIFRRMSLRQQPDFQSYAQTVADDEKEAGELARDLLISVTWFFRDPELWNELEQSIVPKICAAKSEGESIRLWVPGCATGEEAYSYGIVFLRQLQKIRKRCKLLIYATDVDDRARDFAREGLYRKNIANDIAPETLAEFFDTADEEHYRVCKTLRETVVFAKQDLIHDPPFSGLDLLSCRNLLIYLSAGMQHKILPLFHFALKKDAYLVLGSAENIGSHTDLFRSVSTKHRIFRRIGEARQPDITFSGQPDPTETPNESSRRGGRVGYEETAQRLLTEFFSVAGAMVDREFKILFTRGNVDEYLSYPEGVPTQDLMSVVRPTLKSRLRQGLREMFNEGKVVTLEQLPLAGSEQSDHVRITLKPTRLSRHDETIAFIIFERVKSPTSEDHHETRDQHSPDEAVVRHLETELQSTRAQLQGTIEDLETSNEELKASNEEVMSMNEELQSSNEELETSKEELQSVNEELTTVNRQLEEKMHEVESTNDDLQNLLSSSDVAVVFLDQDFRVQRFTPQSAELFNLIHSDNGRPISDLTTKLRDPELLDDARKVLRSLQPVEKEISTHDRRWFLRRINPYRTEDNNIEGVVLTFVEVTALKEAQRRAEENLRLFRVIGHSIPYGVWWCDAEGRSQYVSDSFLQMTGKTMDEIRGFGWTDLLPEEDVQPTLDAWQACREAGNGWEWENRVRSKSGDWVTVLSVGQPLRDDEGNIEAWAGLNLDITDRKQSEDDLRKARDQALAADRAKSAFLANMSHDIRTPLTAITGFSALLRDCVERDDAKEMTEEINDACEQLMKILDSVLKYARIEGGKMELELAPTNVAEELAKTAEIFREPARQKSIDLEAAIEPGVWADVDAAALYRVVANLLDNAIKYSSEGQTIYLKVEKTASQACIRVIDHGLGMSETFRDKLFQAFAQEREKQPEALGGSGLGMAIAKQLIELMHGSIEIDSKEGDGTEVRVYLPLIEEPPKLPAPPEEEEPAPAPSDSLPRVLLCEDYRPTRQTVAAMLPDYDLTFATNENELFEKLDGQDIILLDINLSRRELGNELLDELRQTSTGKTARIVAFTAHATPEARERFLDQGFDAFLPKPFRKAELLQVLQG